MCGVGRQHLGPFCYYLRRPFELLVFLRAHGFADPIGRPIAMNRSNDLLIPELRHPGFPWVVQSWLDKGCSGFTHVWGRSRAGKNVVRQVTAKNRFARALAAVTAWCRVNRHRSIPDRHAHLTAMMRGHYAYYGITGNSRRISWYARQVATIWQKWLSRRDRRNRFPKSRFSALLQRHPLPAARIVHRYTFASKALP